MICPYCHENVPDSLDSCPTCGLDLSEYRNAQFFCPICGTELRRFHDRCPKCNIEREVLKKLTAFPNLSAQDKTTLSNFDYAQENGKVTLLRHEHRWTEEVVLPENVVRIGENCFEGGKGHCRSIKFNRGLREIGRHAFIDNDNIATINLPDTVEKIEEEAFFGLPRLQRITVPSAKEIGKRAFSGSEDLSVVIFGQGVKAIPDNAFEGCKNLLEVDFGGVEKVGSYAFKDCSEMTIIVLPDTIKYMGSHVFENCKDLSVIHCIAPSKPAGWAEDWCDTSLSWSPRIVWNSDWESYRR